MLGAPYAVVPAGTAYAYQTADCQLDMSHETLEVLGERCPALIVSADMLLASHRRRVKVLVYWLSVTLATASSR